ARVLQGIRGATGVNVDQLTGQPVLQVKVRQDQLARYGVPAKVVLDLVESLGGVRLSEVYERPYRFPLVVRLPEKYRGGKEQREQARKASAGIAGATARGERIPLERLASVEVLEDSPSTVTREWGQRRVTVTANVDSRERGLGSFVAEAQREVAARVQMPS